MRYRALGKTEIRVSEIGFPAGTSWGAMEKRDALRLLDRARDLGVTLLDTADSYGLGNSEELVGEAVRRRRHEVVVATKFGYDIYSAADPARPGERPQRWDPVYARKALEGSLRRMKTDYVDLYQLHHPPLSAIQDDALLQALEAFVREGKVRAYGVALGPGLGWEEGCVAALGTRPIASLQTVYNVLEQDPGRALIQKAKEAGVGVLARMPFSSELLRGASDPRQQDEETVGRLSSAADFQELPEELRKVPLLSFLTEGTGRTLAQAALKFVLAEAAVASVLPTITTVDKLEELVLASDGVEALTGEELARVRELDESGLRPAPAER